MLDNLIKDDLEETKVATGGHVSNLILNGDENDAIEQQHSANNHKNNAFIHNEKSIMEEEGLKKDRGTVDDNNWYSSSNNSHDMIISPRRVDVKYSSQNDRFRDGLSSSRLTPRNVQHHAGEGGGSPRSPHSLDSYSARLLNSVLNAPSQNLSTPEYERSNSMAQHISLQDTDHDEEVVDSARSDSARSDSARKSQYSRREPTPKLSAMMQKFESHRQSEFADPNDFYDM